MVSSLSIVGMLIGGDTKDKSEKVGFASLTVKFLKILWRGAGKKETDGLTLRHSGEAERTTHQTPLNRSKFLIRRETRCQLQSGDCYAGPVLKILLLHHVDYFINGPIGQLNISCISFRGMECGLKS